MKSRQEIEIVVVHMSRARCREDGEEIAFSTCATCQASMGMVKDTSEYMFSSLRCIARSVGGQVAFRWLPRQRLASITVKCQACCMRSLHVDRVGMEVKSWQNRAF